MEMAMRSVALITALAVTIFSGARAVKVAKPETKMACFNDNAEQAEKTSDEGMTCRPLKTKDRLTAVYRQDFHHTKACVVATTVVLLASIPSVSIAQDAEAVGEVEEAEIVVQATRSGRRVQDEPLRVEVIGREEIEEKALMRPGSVAMVLGETGGCGFRLRRQRWVRQTFASKVWTVATHNCSPMVCRFMEVKRRHLACCRYLQPTWIRLKLSRAPYLHCMALQRWAV